MAFDELDRESELDVVRFELELLTSARWLARLTAAELAQYDQLCDRERELLDLARDQADPRVSSACS